jgi:hypothetical protein
LINSLSKGCGARPQPFYRKEKLSFFIIIATLKYILS